MLRLHKSRPKRLIDVPVFKPAKRGRLPKPLHQVGGARMHITDLLTVGGSYHACFLWRDGSLLADTAFYGWLFESRDTGLYPLAALHYHPSHKPVHLLTPCRLERNLINRQLPGAIEFNVLNRRRDPLNRRLDPRQESDRSRLVELFCRRCGIEMGQPGGFAL